MLHWLALLAASAEGAQLFRRQVARREDPFTVARRAATGGIHRRAGAETLSLTDGASDSFYFTQLSIGTPPQTINVLLDTRTADTIIAGKPCSGGCPASDVALYDYTLSLTATNVSSRLSGNKTTLGDGSDSATGYVFADKMALGNVQIDSGEFLYATSLSSGEISGHGLSGILGLAFNGISRLGTTLFWQNALKETGSADISFHLSRALASSNENDLQPGGEITFGGMNASLYSGDIEFLPVAGKQDTYWGLDVVSFSVNGTSIKANTTTPLAAFDLSSSILAGPPADVARIWAAVPGAKAIPEQNGFYSFPCASPPSISFTFSDNAHAWPISPSDITFSKVNATTCVGSIFAIFTKEGDSFFANATTGADRPGWIFGGTFLKNVYTVLRSEPRSIGFAELSTLAGGTGTPNATSGAATSSSSSVAAASAAAADSVDTKPKLNIGVIVGGVLGGIAALTLLIGTPCYLMRRADSDRRKDEKERKRERQRQRGESTAGGSTMNVNSAAIIYTGPSPATPWKPQPQRSSRSKGSHHSARSGSRDGSRGQRSPGPRSPPHSPRSRNGSLPSASAALALLDSGAGQRSRSGSQSGSPLPPPTPSSDPAVMSELRQLREEVRRMADDRNAPPPSFSV